MRTRQPSHETGYTHSPEAEGRHLRTLDGRPRPQLSDDEIRRRMARVPTVQAVMRGEEPPVAPPAPKPEVVVSLPEPSVEYNETNWRLGAACLGMPDRIFFLEKGDSAAEAMRTCLGRCTVRSYCLNAALEEGEQFGIWGGLTERKLRRLRRENAQRKMYAA